MWQPNTGQWAVIGATALLLNVLAFNGQSVLFVSAVVVVDGVLIVWWMEGRKRLSPAERVQHLRAVLYVVGAFACGALAASLSGTTNSDERSPEWLGRASVWPVLGLLSALVARRFRRSFATSVPKWMFWFSVVALFLGSAGRMSNAPSTLSDRSQQSLLNPYEFFKQARALGQSEFDKGAMEGLQDLQDRLQETYPGGTFKPQGPVEITDLGVSMRWVARYSGVIPEQDSSGRTEFLSGQFQLRVFFHGGGLAVIESSCFPELAACEDFEPIVAEAEAELLDHLAESRVGGILPSAGGECSVESVENPYMSQTSDVAVCQYGDARVVSLSRMNLADTNNALEALDF